MNTITAAGAGNRNLSASNPELTGIHVAVAQTFRHPCVAKTSTIDKIVSGLRNKGTPVTDKTLGPIIHFAKFPDMAPKRELGNCAGASAIVLDFDGRNGDRVSRADAESTCELMQVGYISWNTFSSTPDDDFTFRLVLPTEDLIPIDQYKGRTAEVCKRLGIAAPGKLMPASQGFFFSPREGGVPQDVRSQHGVSVGSLFGEFKGEVEHFDKRPETLDILTEKQVADARVVIKEMRQRNLHAADGHGVWHQVLGALAPYGDIGVQLANEFSEGDPSYDPKAVERKIRDKLKNGATGIGRLFEIAAEAGIANPAAGRRPSAAEDFAEEMENPRWKFKPLDMGKVMREDPKPIKWLFHQRVPGNRGALLTGLGGTSKTQMLYQMAIAAILGQCSWGWNVDATGKAVLILTEDDENDPHITIHTIKMAMDLTAEQCRNIEENMIVFPLAGEDLKLMIRDPDSSSLIESGHLRGFEEMIKEVGNVAFVGIDPALGVTEGDEASQSDQRALGRMADNLAVRCGCSVFILTHGTKGSLQSDEINSHSSRGGGAITDAVRAEYGMRTMTPKEAEKFGVTDIAERESYVQLKATKGNRIPPEAKVPVWFRRGRGGFLETVELVEAQRGGISPLAKRVLDTMIEMDPGNNGVRLQNWRHRCIEKTIIVGLGDEARRKAMGRAVKNLGNRIKKKDGERGVYQLNMALLGDEGDDDLEDAA